MDNNIKLDTFITFNIINKSAKKYKLYMWSCGKMAQEAINDLPKYQALKDRVVLAWDAISYDIDEVVYRTKTNSEDYGVIYNFNPATNTALTPIIQNTRVRLELRLYDYSNNHDTKITYVHMWLPGIVKIKQVNGYIDGEYFRSKLLETYGTTTCLVCEKTLGVMKKGEDFYGLYFDSIKLIKNGETLPALPVVLDSSNIVYEAEIINPFPEKIIIEKMDIEKMNVVELLNLKDRIDEKLFKYQYDFTDDEYGFYLENEDFIKPENIKEFYKIYLKDNFKIKKMRIRKILEKEMS